MSQESYCVEHQRLLPISIEDRLASWIARSAGVGLCLAGLAGWLSLVTWSVSDPSLSHASFGPMRNLLGPAGAVVSDLMLQMLGLAAVFVVLAPAVWGVELLSQGRIAAYRMRGALLLAAVLALAAGCSALPTAAAWPLHSGFGGVIGDLLYNLVAGLLAAAIPGRSGAVAGLALFSGGLAAFICCLGIEGRWSSGFWQPELTSRHKPVLSGWRRALRVPVFLRRRSRREPSLDPASKPFRLRQPGFAVSWPDLGHEQAAQPPRPAFTSNAAGARPAAGDGDPGPRDTDFDVSTDLDSRRIAERFAPANAQLPPGAPPPAAGGLLGGLSLRRSEAGFQRPGVNMLKRPAAGKPGPEFTQAVLRGTARLLEDVLADFGVKGEIKEIKPGPVVTLFELEPARGTKSARVVGLAEDIARSMSATAVRVAVVPGRNVIGIELPNTRRETVLLREMFEAEAFRTSDARLPLALGKSIGGDPVVVDLARMPHLLVAGTTGSGKSVGVNAMVLSLLYKLAPEDCRLLMIDPKMLELSVYNGIPHLLTPVVTDPQKAVAALNWVVREMEERYKRMARLGVRSIDVFNNRVRHAKTRGDHLRRTVQTGFDRRTGQAVFETEELDLEPMPCIVVVVDEFADLMIVAGKEIESAVQRLAQMARAAGIHLIMATQRPSVDIITGTIKANFPTRISFKVTSKIDSRTILNEQGAEQLLGQGDMLFSAGSGQVQRVHGPFVSDEEVESIAQFLREQGQPEYVEGITDGAAGADELQAAAGGKSEDGDLYDKAVAIVLRDRKASTSYLQRRLQIGYNRAADLIERMERDGIISPANAMGKREILLGGASAAAPTAA
ncbi:MAG: DNA translocase FtsK 4TM domain-containing protein [Hyphomicrobiaceae bacterium]|nr:DNA translocase FtsK 4TM domain-containing protein [Hyphomicrobiaceae bacterium]